MKNRKNIIIIASIIVISAIIVKIFFGSSVTYDTSNFKEITVERVTDKIQTKDKFLLFTGRKYRYLIEPVQKSL